MEKKIDLNKLTLQTSHLHSNAFASIATLIARYPPFNNFAFNLMVSKISDQLKFKSNVTAIFENKIVAYAGWIIVNDYDANRWYVEGGTLPQPNWEYGDAIIVTMTVTEHRVYLLPLIRAISHLSKNKNGYALRSYQDGRLDLRQKICTGKSETFYHKKPTSTPLINPISEIKDIHNDKF
jgi:hemolysin-activating ACP:hemolysin acyltransferase